MKKRNKILISIFAAIVIILGILLITKKIDDNNFNKNTISYDAEYMFKVTYLVVDSAKTEKDVKIADLKSDTMLNFINQYIPLTKKGEYLYAKLNDFANDIAFKNITDYVFTIHDLSGTKIDGCEFNEETTEIKIPISYYENKSQEVPIQMEIQTRNSLKDMQNAKVDISLKNIYTKNIAVPHEAITNTTTISISNSKQTNLKKNNIKIYVNNQKDPIDSEYYEFNSKTGVTTINYPAFLISKLNIKIEDSLINKILNITKVSATSSSSDWETLGKSMNGFKVSTAPSISRGTSYSVNVQEGIFGYDIGTSNNTVNYNNSYYYSVTNCGNGCIDGSKIEITSGGNYGSIYLTSLNNSNYNLSFPELAAVLLCAQHDVGGNTSEDTLNFTVTALTDPFSETIGGNPVKSQVFGVVSDPYRTQKMSASFKIYWDDQQYGYIAISKNYDSNTTINQGQESFIAYNTYDDGSCNWTSVAGTSVYNSANGLYIIGYSNGKGQLELGRAYCVRESNRTGENFIKSFSPSSNDGTYGRATLTDSSPTDGEKIKYETVTVTNSYLRIKWIKKDSKTNAFLTSNIGFTVRKGSDLVRFLSKDSDGCYTVSQSGTITELTPNSDGYTCIKNVESGVNYIVEESKVPSGYQKMPNQTVSTAELVKEYTFTNTPLEIKFYKEDSETGVRINNAGFSIYKGSTLVKFDERGSDGCYKENANGSVTEVFTNTSINNGEVCLSYVSSGSTYTVKETTIPSGYQKMNDGQITAQLNTSSTNLTRKGFTDTPLEIKFYKEDSETGVRINNAGFKIYKGSTLVKFDERGSDGCYKENANGSVTEVFTNTSINNGEVCLSYVSSGSTYRITETSVPNGYKKMPDATITAQANTNTATNISEKGLRDTPLYIYFNKKDSKTSNPIIGAEFEVYKNNSLVKFTQKAGEDCYIESANGNITKLYSKNITIKSTNENGNVSTKQINGGVCIKYVSANTKYTIKETNPTDGYTFFKPQGQDSGIKIEVSNLNAQTNYNLDDTPRENSEMLNYPTMLEFEKKAEDDPNSTDATITQLIDGTLFEIVNSKNEVMKFVDKGNGSYEYSANGTITRIHTTNRKFKVEYLPWDDYKVREVETNAPDGYYYNKETSSFNITKYTNGVVTNMDSAKANIVNSPVIITFEKEDIYNYYTSEDQAKIESDEKLLDTAKFVMKDSNGSTLSLKYVGQTEEDGNIYRYYPVNSSNTISEINTYKGKLKITHLKNNTKYIIEEVKGIDGFILPEDHPKKEYSINREKPEDKNDSSITQVIENTPTRIKIEKRDLKTNNLIDDEKVTFELYRKEDDGSLTRIYVTERTFVPNSEGTLENAYRYSKLNEKTNVRITTYNGVIVIRYLPKGNYVLKEVEAPDGYDLPVGELSNTYFEVNDKTTEVDTEVIKNKPSKIIIRKYSSDGYLITGARFRIYKVTNYDPNLSAKNQEKVLLSLKTIRQGEYENKEVRDTEEVTTCESNCEVIGTETNEQGIIQAGELIIQYLETESYYVIEEVQAPEGYSLPEDPYNIVYLKESVQDEDIELKIENEYTPITFYKYDEYNQLLDGGEYKLQKLNSNKKYEDINVSKMENKEGSVYIVDYNTDNTVITTTEGSATIYMLTPGQYRVLETKAPDGYDLPKASVNVSTFFVTDTGQTKGDFIISNKKPTNKNVILNKADSELVISIRTGQKVIKYMVIIVSLVLAIGLLMFIIRKMNKKA